MMNVVYVRDSMFETIDWRYEEAEFRRQCRRQELNRGSCMYVLYYVFFSSRRRHTRLQGDWSSDVCSSDLNPGMRMHPIIRTRVLHEHVFPCQGGLKRRSVFPSTRTRSGRRRASRPRAPRDRKSVV